MRELPDHFWDFMEDGDFDKFKLVEQKRIDPRQDCPWKCKLNDPKCLCQNQQLGKTDGN